MRKTLIDRPNLRVTFSHRPTTGMGRFGGGWQWQVGFQAGAGFRTIIVNLLVCSLRIERDRIRRARYGD